MKIILCDDAQEVVYDTIEVDPSTLIATDSTGNPVVLFPRPGERDMSTLPQLVEEALRDEARRPFGSPLERLRRMTTTQRQALEARWRSYQVDPRPGHHDLSASDAELIIALANEPEPKPDPGYNAKLAAAAAKGVRS